MKRMRVSVLSGLLLVAVLLLTACAPVAPQGAAPAAGGEAASSEAPVTITWAFWGDPPEVESHKKVADAFMAEHPNIKIDIWNQPWGDYFTKIQALWASGDPKVIPDIAFLWPTPNMRPRVYWRIWIPISRSPATNWMTIGPGYSNRRATTVASMASRATTKSLRL
ncbi:MAG: extracellular solute-binding protein [Anaerolineales bacterium]|nr:extracellular solute-binding protein [Anaerolineales bacterium]